MGRRSTAAKRISPGGSFIRRSQGRLLDRPVDQALLDRDGVEPGRRNRRSALRQRRGRLRERISIRRDAVRSNRLPRRPGGIERRPARPRPRRSDTRAVVEGIDQHDEAPGLVAPVWASTGIPSMIRRCGRRARCADSRWRPAAVAQVIERKSRDAHRGQRHTKLLPFEPRVACGRRLPAVSRSQCSSSSALGACIGGNKIELPSRRACRDGNLRAH